VWEVCDRLSGVPVERRGHIVSAEWLEADSDGAAEALARGRCGPDIPEVEVWCGTRRVVVVHCPPDTDEKPMTN
jgi:hypothetical protein